VVGKHLEVGVVLEEVGDNEGQFRDAHWWSIGQASTYLVGEGSVDGGLGVGLESGLVLLGEVDLRGSKSGGSDEVEGGVAKMCRKQERRGQQLCTSLQNCSRNATYPTSFLASQRKGFSKL
jgi:hypothetical protein